MTGIRLQTFSGELPKFDPRVLPDTFAAAALNVSLQSGSLRGINEPQLAQDLGGRVEIIRKVFRLDNDGEDFWFGLSDPDVDVIKAPLVNDQFERYYWTQRESFPVYNPLSRMLTLLPPYRLGIPTPVSVPTLVVNGGGLSDYEQVTRAYVFTYVSAYGEEGPPSPPVEVAGFDDGDWDLAGLNQVIVDDDRRTITTKRIYRTITGLSGATAFFKVADIDIDQNTYTDNSSDLEVSRNALLQSATWAEPPTGLKGLVAMPGGFLAGFVGRDIYFSVPFRPHAWPAGFVVSMEWPVVGLGVYGTTLVVMTEGMPQACTGNHPAVMTIEKIDTPEPCLSKGSIVSAPEGVYYAGPNGLILVTQGGPVNVLKDVVSRDDWNTKFFPGSIRAARHKIGYVGLTAEGKGFIVELGASAQQAFVQFTNMAGAQNIQNDYRSGDVYLIARQDVYVWDPTSPPRTVGLWRSKEFLFPRGVNLGVFMIKMDLDDAPAPPTIGFEPTPDSDPDDPQSPSPTQPIQAGQLQYTVPEGQRVRFRLWADRRLVYDNFVNDNLQHKLPSGYKAEIYQIELVTRVTIYSIEIGETHLELQNA